MYDQHQSNQKVRNVRSLILFVFLTAVVSAEPAKPRGEFLQMWDAIVSGAGIGPGAGWFKPSQARYTWERLAKHFDRDSDGRVTAKELGSPELFVVLDRDRDQAITADDLDWSENATYFRQMNHAQQLLRQADGDNSRAITQEEWAALFNRVAQGKKTLDAQDLRALLYPAPPAPKGKGGGGMPPKEILLYGLLTGEIGSGAEGPALNAIAPDFTLADPESKKKITLSEYRTKKPVVLIFGSFT